MKIDDGNQYPGNLLFEWRWPNEIFIPQILILRSQNDEIYTVNSICGIQSLTVIKRPAYINQSRRITTYRVFEH